MPLFSEDDPRLVYIPLDQATNPPNGFNIHFQNRWWAFHPQRGLIFYRAYKKDPLSPQCNADESITRRILAKLYPWAEILFVPSAFVKADTHDYFL